MHDWVCDAWFDIKRLLSPRDLFAFGVSKTAQAKSKNVKD
jgi:hypothetical protein